MAHALASERSQEIAAMAEAGASVARLDSAWVYHSQPDPKRPVSVLMMHGMLDDVCGYDMRSFSLDIPTAAEWWAKRVAPGAPKVHTDLASGAVLQDAWVGKGADVTLLSFRNLTHEWPGTRDEIDGFETNETVWKFLSAHSL